ncbi:MAG: aminotransferase class V-fold PLP-dependent enzyme [Gammaproteobacteria bacterium]|nr:MAG: aminotransferase class V-fold PLP-dependent enzyme [Gammaproteobacteria bacterium]
MHGQADSQQITVDWDALRARFPVFARRTYINSCSYGALATDVQQAIERYLQDRLELGCDWDYWVERNETARAAFARLLGAKPAEIAVTTSASAGLNSLASALDFTGPRNKIVISDYEFPTDAQIWYAQERRGARVCRVGETDGYIPLENFARAIDAQTRLVAVTQVCFRNGARLDIPGIARLAHEHGAWLLVDGYQGFGTMPFDVHAADVDFAVGGCVKYLLGTAGVGFLYVRESLVEQLVPTVTGWFAQEDIFAMDTTRYDPAHSARRFETGTPPVVNIYAAIAGLEILHEVGLPAIGERIATLTAGIKSRAAAAGLQLATPSEPERHGAMIALRCRDAAALVAALEKRAIVTSHRDNNLRISPHFYNNEQDLDTLFAALEELREYLL